MSALTLISAEHRQKLISHVDGRPAAVTLGPIT